ncbi:MAG: MOSC N-terminal beta barrel domain-containing protein [Planctomycetaceae bacterium]|nr:MOSC N-terminal beta barrel domain-containing protein [Planctomycetaceae bacterium]
MPQLSRITIYPIKSLDGFTVASAELMPTGPLVGDRRWAIVDPMRQFVNGKRTAAVHPIRAAFEEGGAVVTLSRERLEAGRFRLPDEASGAAAWLSEAIGRKCLLIENLIVGFPDDADAAGPTLVSTASLMRVAEWFALDLDEVRRRMRANLEIDAAEPFWEDRLAETDAGPISFAIGSVRFRGRTACQRCVVPTRDSASGDVSSGFAKTFSAHRQAELPSWAPTAAFNHFYRLTLNTSLDPAAEGPRQIRVGDELRTDVALSAPGSAGG